MVAVARKPQESEAEIEARLQAWLDGDLVHGDELDDYDGKTLQQLLQERLDSLDRGEGITLRTDEDWRRFRERVRAGSLSEGGDPA